MDAPRRIPWSVRIIAYLFALGGISSLATLILKTIRGDINVMDLLWYLLQMEIAYGLLRLSRFWRFVALSWFTVGALSAVAFCAAISFSGPSVVNATIELFDVFILYQVSLPRSAYLAIGLGFILLYGWQWWALDRPEVRKLFIPQKQTLQVQHS